MKINQWGVVMIRTRDNSKQINLKCKISFFIKKNSVFSIMLIWQMKKSEREKNEFENINEMNWYETFQSKEDNFEFLRNMKLMFECLQACLCDSHKF